MNSSDFNTLSLKRAEWVRTTKSNGFDNGIKNLLTELYPDNAHFIYELLQNSEDTEATEVKFILKKNELVFQHNGRDFDFKNIEAITSIGQGTKRDDVNKIGKFGVGFKAIFAYTSTPHIYSNNFCFLIDDLVIPKKINKKIFTYPTTMIFPFNNQSKNSETAYEEIKTGLLAIQDNTLLFLKNINTIVYEVAEIRNEIKRNEVNDIKVNITNSLTQNETNWLRFKKFLPESNNLFVSVAYKLEYNEEYHKDQIVPIDGEVSIFFPAEKETSKLRFHIHAPFSSTVARDSIKDIDENNKLRDLISILITESLEYIKINNYLDFSFLQTLPIEEDNLANFYKPILESIIKTFNDKEYLKDDKDKFRKASICFRSSKKIKTLIDTADLQFLTKSDHLVYWAKNPPQLNSREDKFLKQLDIQNIDYESFLDLIMERSKKTISTKGEIDEFEW